MNASLLLTIFLPTCLSESLLHVSWHQGPPDQLSRKRSRCWSFEGAHLELCSHAITCNIAVCWQCAWTVFFPPPNCLLLQACFGYQLTGLMLLSGGSFNTFGQIMAGHPMLLVISCPFYLTSNLRLLSGADGCSGDKHKQRSCQTPACGHADVWAACCTTWGLSSESTPCAHTGSGRALWSDRMRATTWKPATSVEPSDPSSGGFMRTTGKPSNLITQYEGLFNSSVWYCRLAVVWSFVMMDLPARSSLQVDGLWIGRQHLPSRSHCRGYHWP